MLSNKSVVIVCHHLFCTNNLPVQTKSPSLDTSMLSNVRVSNLRSYFVAVFICTPKSEGCQICDYYLESKYVAIEYHNIGGMSKIIIIKESWWRIFISQLYDYLHYLVYPLFSLKYDCLIFGYQYIYWRLCRSK